MKIMWSRMIAAGVLCALAAFSIRADEFIVEPGGKWPTIQSAIDRAGPGDTVTVRAGTYVESLKVSKRYDGAPLTVRAAKGNRVVVSGFARIEGWKDVGGGIYAARTDGRVDALFVGFAEQQCGRWPRDGTRRPVLGVDHDAQAFQTEPVGRELLLAAVAKDPKGAIAFYYDRHANRFGTMPVKSYDAVTGVLSLAPKKWNAGLRQEGNSFSLMNHPAFVKGPGDWAFVPEGAGGTVYFRPKSPADLSATRFRAVRAPLVLLSGGKNAAGNVVFDGLEFTGSADVGARVGADDVTFQNCIFHHNAGGGLAVRFAKSFTARSNVIVANGGHGLCLASLDGGLVEGNEIGWNLVDGLVVAGDISGRWRLGDAPATRRVAVRRNLIHHHILQAHPDNIQFYRGVADVTVAENVLLWGGQSLMAEEAEDVVVSGNVVMGCSAIMLICGHGNSNRWRFTGNTLWGSGYGFFSFTGRDYEVDGNLLVGGDMPYGPGDARVNSHDNHFAPRFIGQTTNPWRRYEGLARALKEIGQEKGSTEGEIALRNFPRGFTVAHSNDTACDSVALRGKGTACPFAVGDKVEFNGDGRLRTVTAFDGKILSFTPALPALPFRDVLVANWGDAESARIDNRPFAEKGAKISVADFMDGDLLGEGRRTLPALPDDVAAALPDPNNVVVPLTGS